MRYRVDDQIVFQSPPCGPLVPWLGEFAKLLRTQQYKRSTIYRQLRQAVHFSEWLERQQIELSALSHADVGRYLGTRQSGPYTEARNHVTRMMDFLCSRGVVPAKGPTRMSPGDHCIRDYGLYLRTRRNLSERTIGLYTWSVRRFLRFCFGEEGIDLATLRHDDVIAFVRCEATRPASRSSMQSMVVALRSFLRYVHAHAERMPDLAGHVPSVANWAMTSVPRGIDAGQVERLLDSIERTTVIGRRDYAMVLLLARLGLRAVEVAGLTLDDIDWTMATLTVTRKGGRASVLPLTAEIGEALAGYLQNGRPASDDRRVFLRIRAPLRGFSGACGVQGAIRCRLARSGMKTPTKGTHQFRHGLATGMLGRGVTLHEIGDVLGHRRADTTRIYAKVDIDTLRTLALPWPGGER